MKRKMEIFDVDIEEAAEESEQDRRDHARLQGDLDKLLEHEDTMRVPVAVRRLVDRGVDPVVVAKTLLIGARGGGAMYELSSRSLALAQDEGVAELWIGFAIRDVDPDLAATMLVAGAVWLAMQFGIDKEMLAGFVRDAARRPIDMARVGYGAVDLVDNHGVGDREQVRTGILLAELPMFAPLEYKPS